MEYVDKLLARTGRDPVVMVHVGTNYIGKGRSDKFVELASKIRSRPSTVVCSRILSVPPASREKQNFIWRFNTCLWKERAVQVYGAQGLLLGLEWAIQAWLAGPAPEGNLYNGSVYSWGSTGLFKQGNWGAGRIESEMGRDAQTAQMDTIKDMSGGGGWGWI